MLSSTDDANLPSQTSDTIRPNSITPVVSNLSDSFLLVLFKTYAESMVFRVQSSMIILKVYIFSKCLLMNLQKKIFGWKRRSRRRSALSFALIGTRWTPMSRRAVWWKSLSSWRSGSCSSASQQTCSQATSPWLFTKTLINKRTAVMIYHSGQLSRTSRV